MREIGSDFELIKANGKPPSELVRDIQAWRNWAEEHLKEGIFEKIRTSVVFKRHISGANTQNGFNYRSPSLRGKVEINRPSANACASNGCGVKT